MINPRVYQGPLALTPFLWDATGLDWAIRIGCIFNKLPIEIMGHPVTTRTRHFLSKKEALEYFGGILQSTPYGATLGAEEFDAVLALLETHPKAKEKIGAGIAKIRICRIRHDTRCFEFTRIDGTVDRFSYRKLIQRPPSQFQRFSMACRAAVVDDLRDVKLAYFKANSKRGLVPCQDTGVRLTWEELAVDHRLPNSFSVIVDRFIEIHDIKIDAVQYDRVFGEPNPFTDSRLAENFRKYHGQKARLRIVARCRNFSRAHHARVKQVVKDLTVNRDNVQPYDIR